MATRRRLQRRANIFCLPAALMVARLTGAKAWLQIQNFEVDTALQCGKYGPYRLMMVDLSARRGRGQMRLFAVNATRQRNSCWLD